MATTDNPLHIDIPVKLAEVKEVYSIGALAFEGDLPACLFHLQLIENDISDWNARSQVIAVFHTSFPESKSTRMPWRERRSSFRKASSRSRNEPQRQPTENTP
jgi:hypothetical protein